MAEIKSVDQIAEKWARVTPQRTADYESGVRNPRKDWARSTAAASDAWKSGVQAAIAASSFSKGVARVGTAKWQEGAVSKGVPRWGAGVSIGKDAYQTGFAPYQAAIERVSLPPRFARRDPRNLERVKAIVDAMSAVKKTLMGSGSA